MTSRRKPIVAGHVAFQTVRFQASLFPDTMYGVLTDVKRHRQFAATPMGGTIARLLPRGSQNPGPQSGCQYAGRLPGMKGVEPIEPILKKTLLPSNYLRRRVLHPLLIGLQGPA